MAMKGAKNAKNGGKTQVVPGDILLGKYRVERKLGQGGMGIVVAARHLELGELFAIKYLAKGARSESNAVQRFLREARSSARLKGEHVAKVHDVGRLDSGLPYMIMEYLIGQDLKAYLHKHGKLPLEEAVSFVLQAIDAVSEAHSLGIIHRDLKPSNLFLTKRRDGTSCIKVLDFGIAKEISAKDAELTKSGATLGSPLYMSPEQMAGSKALDTRTDIWSMGIVLYELVTGAVPFRAETVTELVAQVLQSVPKPPSHLYLGLPPWIDDVIMHCLEKHPENRFLTIDDFALALRAAGKAGAMVARVSPDVADDRHKDLLEGAPKENPGRATSSTGDIPLQNPQTSTQDVQTLDSSTDAGVEARASRDKEIAVNTQTNPAWDTATGATSPSPRNRSKLGVMVGAVLAIVVLTLGSLSFFRAQITGKNSAATSSEVPPTATESAEPVPLASMPTPAPSAALEAVPQDSIRDPQRSTVADAALSASPQMDGAALPGIRAPKALSVASAAASVGKKETAAGPQATATVQEVPPVPNAAPAPSSGGPPKGRHEGVL